MGVDEESDGNGMQKGKIVGCGVSDEDKLKIIGKANQCIPHIHVDIITENLNCKPFLRVEIPPSPKMPHCTQRGVYKTRGDRQNRAMLPQELLKVFLEAESENFLQKYSRATIQMRNQLNELHSRQLSELQYATWENETNINQAVEAINGLLGDLLAEVENSVERVGAMVNDLQDDTELLKDDIELNHEINNRLRTIDDNTIHVAWKLNSILEHLGLEDPEITVARDNMKMMLEAAKRTLKDNAPKGKELEKFLGDLYDNSSPVIQVEYTVEDLMNWYKEIK